MRSIKNRALRLTSLMVTTSLSMLILASAAHAQDAETIDPEDEDVIIATGQIQRTLERSLAVKRNTTVVSDALVGAEIGDLPDLSIAESLERITGVTSDRFKGGASELSIRGLGAFLGSSVLNGREITTGSDGRDVNFGQFPSELIGSTQVFKSQQADFVEGGISGIIELQTLRPLDYGKRRIQVQGLAGYSEYEDRVVDGQPISARITGSYTDQFETGVGDIGIAFGGQIRRDTAAEDIYTSSSTFNPCTTNFSTDGGSNCSFNEGSGEELYFVSNQYIYRAQETDADRDSLMGNFQWRPNESWDINFDGQWSDRRDVELRHNLVVSDGRRRITPLDVSESGALNLWTGQSRLENQSVFRERTESYLGLGLNVEWNSDRLTIAADAGFSETKRRQDEKDMRAQSEGPNSGRVDYQLYSRDVTIPVLTALDPDFDLNAFANDYETFTRSPRARRRLENNDEDILAFRLDADYELNGSFFNSISVGGRYADRNRVNDDGIDTVFQRDDVVEDGYLSDAAIAARRDTFPVRDLFDGTGSPMEGLTFATFNSEALFVALTGSEDAGLPTGSTLDTNDSDVDETTYAAYAMADFEGNALDLPIYGNIGLRTVYTEIASRGIRTDFVTDTNEDGELVFQGIGESTVGTEENDFWNFLPSANIVFELQENQLLRFAAYRAIARPDVRDMSAALSIDEDAGFDSIDGAFESDGNPFLEPLVSSNFDVSFEWYVNDDTSFSAAVYHKILETGRGNEPVSTSLVVDGVDTPITISRPVNSDETSDLTGLELSLNHKFSSLPGPLSGFGVSAGYNFAASNFETPDPSLARGIPVAPLVEPANIPGYSKHSGNVTAYWENDDLTIRVAYKGRSPYYKPFRISALRYTNSQEFIDASLSYDLTDNIELRAQALNLTNEPNLFFRPTRDSFAQADYSGRRFFLGARARF